jgi:molybdopterin-guanine dinucleotide biosynthesis protein A
MRPSLALPNIPDQVPGAGPLAALRSVLSWAEEHSMPLVATFSCDTPFVPRDTVSVLRASLEDFDCTVAIRAGVTHPTCALWKTAARHKIEIAFRSGVRSLHGAMSCLNAFAVDFSAAGDGPDGDPFFNINSEADMAIAQVWLDEGHIPKS